MSQTTGLNAQQIDEVVAFIENQGLSDETVLQLRQRYSGCHFTYCMDDDVHFSKAYIERPGFNVYLVDSRQHCSELTTDTGTASGIVLAEIFI
jgi:hypothetical protein